MMLAALSFDGFHAPRGVDEAAHDGSFRCRVCAVPSPTLQPEDIVLWDNPSAHKVPGIEELLTARGACGCCPMHRIVSLLNV